MNELGPDARALLNAARDAHDIDPATKARLRADMLRRIGAGAVAAGTVAAASKGGVASFTSFTSSLAAKLIVVAAFATGGVLAARHMTRPAPAPTVVAPNAPNAPVAVAPTVVAAATPAADEAPKPPAMAVIEEPAPAPKAPVVAAKPKAAPAPAASSLEDELRALREAHLALREGRPSDALSIVDGMKGNSLGPERAATRAIALCSLGRADAQASAEKFLSTYPSSPLAPRVRAACSIP